jgi:PAS domain S-box-containing protein
MNELHTLLARQVKRYFGSLENLTAECRAFVCEVDEAYREFDTNHGMLERALEISSEEHMQANAQMRALLEAFPDLYFHLDAQGKILECKTGSTAAAFQSAQTLVGKFIQAVPELEVARKFQAAIEQVGRTRCPASLDYWIMTGAGEEYHEARLVPLPRDEIFVVVRDITERKVVEQRLRRSEERLQEAVQVSNIGIFEHDHQTDTIYWSPEQRKSYGWSRDEPVTIEKILQYVHPEDGERIAEAIHHAHDPAGDGRYDVEHRIVRRDGTIRWLLTRSQTFFEGEGPARRLIRTAGAVLDITGRKRIEEALSLSVDRFTSAMEAANDGLWDFHLPTGKSYFSARYYGMLGYDLESFLPGEEAWLNLIHPDDREPTQRKFQAYLQNETDSYEAEFRMRHKAGHYLWILSRGKVVRRDAQGRSLQVVGTHSDITARKLAEEKVVQARDELEVKVQERTRELSQVNASLRESEERARNILNNVQAGIVVVDPVTHEVLEANPVALSLLKRSREEVVGRVCHNHICPADRGQCPVTDLGRTVDNSERVLVRADGTSIPILKTVVPITLGGRPVLLESFVDITERKQAQTELEQAKLAAEVASEAKSRFLAMMSHEIRTPLNGVTGVLHLLQKDHLTIRQQRWLDMASTSAGTLLSVINDILDFSKVEAGKLDLNIEPTDLLALVTDTATGFAERAAARGLAWNLFIDPRVPCWVVTDGGRLSQVLGNLLGNAVKFTDAGGVDLRVALQTEVNDITAVRFEVTDTGEGVSPEQQGRLFKPFSQVDSSTTRRHGGTGLGLGICKHLVELMGGVIGVQTAVGQGSTFWFELPLKKANAAAGPGAVTNAAVTTNSTPSASPNPRRVLLAEDNEINQELAREMIQFAGCECDCVVNGQEAVRAVAGKRYDLLFMDCMMPGMDGYSATQAIRAEEARQAATGQTARRLPIIAMTANAMEGDREKCLAAGMDDYLSKPLDPEKVVKAIQHWLVVGCPEALPAGSGNETALNGASTTTTTGGVTA